MKQATFHIIVNIRTGNGFEKVGKFYIGNNREFARSTFSKLKGDIVPDEKAVLSLDLVETQKGLPLNIQVMVCTLDDLAENCKIIAKDAFKFFNLNDPH